VLEMAGRMSSYRRSAVTAGIGRYLTGAGARIILILVIIHCRQTDVSVGKVALIALIVPRN